MENQHRHITGYRELGAAEIDVMYHIKATAEDVRRLVERVGDLRYAPDQRWMSIGVTHLQQGFMALTRAVAKPTTF
jgi:hypothetical protein